MPVLVSIDAGTTGVRSMVVNGEGIPIASAYREFPQYFPRPGWVEHDADEIWDAVSATLSEVLEGTDDDVAAIGITNQRETVMLWDRSTGQPLHRAIVWQDRRGAALCNSLSDHLPEVRTKTGLGLDPYFSASKLSWLFADGGIAPNENTAFGTVDSWIIWKLTGGSVHATDASNASRTLLYNIRDLRWDPELADLFGVPMSVLPEVGPSSGRLGVTAADAVPHLRGGVPVSGVAGDQQAALFGQTCFNAGMTKNTYGTGSFVLMNIGGQCPEPAEGILTTIAWSLGGTVTYALEGSIFVTGAAVQWLRDGLGIIGSSAEVGPVAESVADTGGAFFVPALTGLGSPWWDPQVRGTIIGLTRGVGRAQLARAVVESMAFQTRDVVDAMVKTSGQALSELRVDGGASVMPLLLQMQSDLLGVPVVRAAVRETTALGAAFLAGLAEGVWATEEEIRAVWSSDAKAQPAADKTLMEASHQTWLRAVERSRNWTPQEGDGEGGD